MSVLQPDFGSAGEPQCHCLAGRPRAWCTLCSARSAMALAVPWAVVWLMGRRAGHCLAASLLHPSFQSPADKPA